MVKVGFIAEGDTEKRILSSERFRQLLKKIDLPYIQEVENAHGVTNLYLPKRGTLVKILKDKGADKVIILTDADGNCIQSVRQKINPDKDSVVIVSVQKIEAWFLADTSAISNFFKQNYRCEFPEKIEDPFEFIKSERKKLTGNGVGDKRILGQRLLQSGFSLESAATHPNCPSAKYFLEKLRSFTKS